MSDDTPTERFTSPTEPRDEPQGSPPGDNDRRSRTLIILLSVLGGLLLIALVVVLTLLLSKGGSDTAGPVISPSDTASVTPTVTPSETPSASPSASPSTPPPPPPSTDPTIDSFVPSSNSVRCNSESPVEFPATLSFKWSTTNAASVFFGVETNDASAEPFFTDLPTSGYSVDDFPDGYRDFTYNCYKPNYSYTMTIIGTNGKKVSKTVTVINKGDTE